jgi:hypothetical protein
MCGYNKKEPPIHLKAQSMLYIIINKMKKGEKIGIPII